MKNYLVTKICRQGYRILVIPLDKSETAKSEAEKGKRKGKRQYCITGNFPALYPKMTLQLDLQNMQMTDYQMELTEENRKALLKNNVAEAEYAKILANHMKLKQDGFTWEDAEVGTEKLYDKFDFCRADRIHKNLVNNASDKLRLKAINHEILLTGRKKRKICYSIKEFFSLFDLIENQGSYGKLIMPIKVECMQSECYGIRNNMVFDKEMKEKEDFVMQNIMERVRNGNYYQLLTTWEIDDFIRSKRGSYLAEEQLEVMNCLYSTIPCIVTGGAGTGKTSVIKTLIECYGKYYGTNYILLVAPTGKASRRLAEKTGMPACTIHKALRKSITDDFTFYNEKNQLPQRLIIVDESSMIDTALMYDLLKATDKASKLIFVGDHNQLPPVGYGEPFFQFMNAMEIYRLEENHRQSEDTDILYMANRALYHMPVTNGRGVSVQEINYNDDIPYILNRYFHEDDENTQIISPSNATNHDINTYIQEVNARKNGFLENNEPYLQGNLYVGDKIMTVRNTEHYCNGDIGYISAINEKEITVQIEGRQIVIPEKDKDDIQLAYAITVHKMQGSEADRVIVFLEKENSFHDESRMLYTAFTRARKELMIYYYQKGNEKICGTF